MARFLVPQRTAVIRRRCPLEALLSEGHLARFVWRTLQSLDFSALERVYATTNGGPGRSPYHPRVLTALWIYGMSQGLETASAIAAACMLRDDFRWLSGGLRPSDQTLLNLLDHAQELVEIWQQVLQAMHREGHVDLSVIAEDGSKVHANASPRSFRTAEEIDAVVNALKAKLAQEVEPAARPGVGPSQIEKPEHSSLRCGIGYTAPSAPPRSCASGPNVTMAANEGRDPIRTPPSAFAAPISVTMMRKTY